MNDPKLEIVELRRIVANAVCGLDRMSSYEIVSGLRSLDSLCELARKHLNEGMVEVKITKLLTPGTAEIAIDAPNEWWGTLATGDRRFILIPVDGSEKLTGGEG